MNSPVKMLYLEDNDIDRRAFLRMVREKGLPYDMTSVETVAAARASMAQCRFDVVVADYHLPDGKSDELFDEATDTPFVLLTSNLGEQLALRTLQRGADDYLAKSADQQHLQAVPLAIEKTMYRKQLRDTERRLSRELHESEERFRVLVEEVQDYAIYLLDGQGIVSTWNKGAECLKGYSAHEVIGRSFSQFFTPQDAAEGKPARQLVLAAEHGRHTEEGWLVRKDGSRFWALSTVHALRTAAGDANGFARITRDLTERKQAEDIQRSLAAIVEGSMDAIVSESLEGQIQTWNAGAERMFGWAEDVIGQNATIVIPPERIDEENLVLEQIKRGEHVDHYETVRITKDGRRLDVSVTLSPIKDKQGRIVGVSRTVRDIGEIVQARQVLMRSKAELEERTQKLRELLGDLEQMSFSMIHDMRAPLRSMRMFAEMLEEECPGLPATGLDYVRRIRDSAGRLDGLVTEALNYAKVVRQELPIRPVEVAALLRGMIESYPNLHPWAAAIRIEFDELAVMGNESLLTQCFGNLLDNAVKFVRPGATPQVAVRADTRDGAVRITVEDHGIGIPHDAHEKIFGIFQRLHRENEYPGKGIGLSIVRKAVERMGGTVSVQSELGKGSKFLLALPQATKSTRNGRAG